MSEEYVGLVCQYCQRRYPVAEARFSSRYEGKKYELDCPKCRITTVHEVLATWQQSTPYTGAQVETLTSYISAHQPLNKDI